MPILSYLRFAFGMNNEYNFDKTDALDTMDTKWIPENIRNQYASFIAFSMNKVFETAKVSITNIPGEVLPDSNLVMIYTSPKSGKSIFFKDIKNYDNNTSNWIFTKRVQNNSVQIFLNDLDNTKRDPFAQNLHYSIWENIPNLLDQYGIYGYVTIISIISLASLYLMYRLSIIVLRPLFRGVGKIFDNKDYKALRKLNIASSLMISLYISYFFFFNSMIVFEQACHYLDFLFKSIYGFVIIFLLIEFVNVLCSFTISAYKKTQTPEKSARFNFALIIANKLTNLVIVIIVIGGIIQQLGINMLHFLTALGIGGLAIALAGKDTIENLFGSIILAIERPIKIGDWVVIGSKQGIVEKIGLRSTVIRTFEDSTLIIPNYSFVTSQINNMGERRYRRYKTILEVDESTSINKLELYIDTLYKIVHSSEYMRKHDFYIRVNDLQAPSIQILIYVFFRAENWGHELQLRQEFILKVLKAAEELNIKLAANQRIQLEQGANIEDIGEKDDF